MVGDENMRIGDAEREAAVAELQNHLAAGRLDPDEFNERMDKAFEARTSSELDALFRDLPGRGGHGTAAQPAYQDPYAEMEPAYEQGPMRWGQEGDVPAQQPVGRPWFAQWWVLLIAIFVSGAADGRLWFLVPLAAIWIWVVYPSMAKNRAARPVAPSGPPRPLTYAERDEVIVALHSGGGEIAAIKRYRELTGADLYTATMTVRAMNRELGH